MVSSIQSFHPTDEKPRAAMDARLRRKLHPARFSAMSAKMAALVGLRPQHGVCRTTALRTVPHRGRFPGGPRRDQLGADTFLGSYIEFVRNWIQLLRAADLSLEEHMEADCRFAARVGVYGEVSA